MSEAKGPLRIRYEYELDPNKRLEFAHGVWGGINPQGEVELNFYTESDKLPPYSERIVAADGGFGQQITVWPSVPCLLHEHDAGLARMLQTGGTGEPVVQPRRLSRSRLSPGFSAAMQVTLSPHLGSGSPMIATSAVLPFSST